MSDTIPGTSIPIPPTPAPSAASIFAEAEERLARSLAAIPPGKNHAIAITIERFGEEQLRGRFALAGRTKDGTWGWETFADYDGDLSLGGTIRLAW